MRINVVKSFLPPKEEYLAYIDKIWDSNWLTNNGPLLLELEAKLSSYIGNEHLMVVTNGTVALQIAIKALELEGEIITTPYSYCATTTSIVWENCKPVFVDINASDFNINADLIEEKITDKTQAILATHVYGNPCDLAKIEDIARKYNLKVIYDAAHTFGVKVDGKSLLNFGDISTCSFHATKVFHTIEGGSITCNDKALFQKMRLYRSFGHINDDYFSMGINGKNSEVHAAMGLSNLPHLEMIIENRKTVSAWYDEVLNFDKISTAKSKAINLEYNYAYYPVVFESLEKTNEVIEKLNEEEIYPRRYFYPSLNKLDYAKSNDNCPISESVVNRVLSLPLYPDLAKEDVIRISNIINQATS